MAFGSPTVVIGLDVGATSVKGVRLGHRSGGARLLGLAMADVHEASDDQPSDEPRVARKSEAIREVLAACGSNRTGRAPIVTAVGGPGVSIKHVAFPLMPQHVLAESIHWEARKHVPFGESEFVLDFQILGSGKPEEEEQKMQVLLAAVETRLVDEHVADLKLAGVEPDTVDLAPLALMNEADEEGLLDGLAIAVVDLGASAINLAIHRRGGLFFSRVVPLLPSRRPVRKSNSARKGAEQRAEGAEAHDASQANDDGWCDVALSEIRRSLAFYNNETGKKGIDKMYLTGGRALVSGIAEELTEALGISTEVLNPLDRIDDTAVDIRTLAEQGPRFALAMGLARRT